jgi:hypothetical protein
VTEDTHTEPQQPERKKPGRKPGQAYGKPETAGPVRSVSMNPRPGGLTMVDIKMELPLALAIKLASAAADIQTEAEAEPVRVGPFPRVAREA